MNRYLCKKGMCMEEKSFTLNYREYDTIEELPATYKHLYKAAIDATENSYAPYSQFNVGAAVLMENGAVITGSNQENAASPSGLCAERVALFAAHHQYPKVAVEAIAIAAKTKGALTENLVYPCAACIQVMVESQLRSRKPVKIIVGSNTRVQIIGSVDSLLPFSSSLMPKK